MENKHFVDDNPMNILTIGWDITDSFNGHLLFYGIYIYAGIFFSFQIVIEEHY
jgi:hypothetical protein